MANSKLHRQRKASRSRNDNARFGFQPSILSKRLHDRLRRDVESGRWGLSKACLNVKIMILGKTPPQAKGIVSGLKDLVGL